MRRKMLETLLPLVGPFVYGVAMFVATVFAMDRLFGPKVSVEEY